MNKMKNDKENNENKEDETKMNNKFIDHIIMNLPAIAMEFLDVFTNCFDSNDIEKYGLPMIHCYCFVPDVNPEKSIYQRLNKYLGCIPDKENLKIRLVRNVAPHKDMYCVSFRLPKKIALVTNKDNDQENDSNKVVQTPNNRKHKLADNDNHTDNHNDNQPPPKRRKIEE